MTKATGEADLNKHCHCPVPVETIKEIEKFPLHLPMLGNATVEEEEDRDLRLVDMKKDQSKRCQLRH